jgi:RHS repeat-associated protein
MTTSIMKRAALGLFLVLVAAPAWALSVSLSAPASGAVFQAGATVTLSATATPTNTSRPITKVEFFRASTTLIGTDTTSPYSFDWTNVPAGSYTITAKATDSSGATATSASRTIKVNAPPAVTLTAPANGAFFNSGSTISLTATATDSDGTISKVDFLQGATLLGTDTSSPYSFSWINVAAGSYTLTARATDSNSGVTTSTAVNIVVDTPPTVSLTAPANGAVFLPGAAIAVTANAADADGTVSKVDFFDGATLVGTATAAPYSVTLGTPATGSHTLTAQATDNLGRATTSTAVTVRVDAAPTVSITAPVSGTVFSAPASFSITASAADADGTVSKVEFFEGATLLGTAAGAPYSVALANVASGTHAYTAKATDNNGAVTTSAAVNVSVNSPPTVSITSPAGGAVFSAPASFSITATASDPDGTIAKVDFFEACLSGPGCVAGQIALGTSTAAPYSVSVTNVAAGSHLYGATATDNSGARTQSAQVSVTVNALPTASITSPVAGAVFTAPASIAITANAADADGTVAKVDFYQGATLLGTSTAAPYSFAWTGVAAGSYSLTVVATDDRGGTTTSAAVAITVNALPTVSITAPTDGAVFAAPATITVTASAADPDGTIAKVDFYQGATLIGTATAAPYSATSASLGSGTYSFTAVATDNSGATTTSAAVSVRVNAAPTVSITTPANGATFTAPANVAISADAADTDGTIVSVAFYQNGSLITTLSSAPYSITWTGVPEGSYSLMAVATDDAGTATTSAAVAVTVNTGVAQMYFIHPDHLNTPRAVADAGGTVVWKWDQTEPFGDSVPDSNPTLVVFEFPLGFAGQYFDKETGNFYNGFRDYASAVGRYVQSDPIGLKAGINTYAYVKLDPLRRTDPAGLEAPTVADPPVRPPVMPPQSGPGNGPDCVNIPPWTVLVSSGGIWGFMRTVTVQCSYYCQPAFCPSNPGDYIYHKTFYDQLQIAPWLSPCPPKVPRSEFF